MRRPRSSRKGSRSTRCPGRQPAGDGIHQRIRKSFNTIHANDFTSTTSRRGHRTRTCGPPRPGTARAGRRDRHPQGPPVRTRRPDEGDPGRRGRRGQCHRTRGVFPTRDPEAFIYENSGWITGFIGGDYRWLDRRRDRRTESRCPHAVLLPGHREHPGDGDEDGRARVAVRPAESRQQRRRPGWSQDYRLRIPPMCPPRISGPSSSTTRRPGPSCRLAALPEQEQPTGRARRSTPTGRSTSTSDPAAPDGQEANWTQTVPGKGGSPPAALRPARPWFDQTWRPGDAEPLS